VCVSKDGGEGVGEEGEEGRKAEKKARKKERGREGRQYVTIAARTSGHTFRFAAHFLTFDRFGNSMRPPSRLFMFPLE